MITIEFNNFSEFEKYIDNVEKALSIVNEKKPSRQHPLFRGQPNSDWKIKSTLDRKLGSGVSFQKYFRAIERIKPMLESLTEKSWKSDYHQDFQDFSRKRVIGPLYNFPAYDYVCYLRHHGFPSPFIDWSISPFVAAFFAFSEPSSEQVAIFMYLETAAGTKTGNPDQPTITNLGPYVTTHRRHFLQQSRYTFCHKWENDQYVFQDHHLVFQSPRYYNGEIDDIQQDMLWKFLIPASERKFVLKKLDRHNLNHFSLFQSEEALLSTLSMREFDFID